MAQSSRTNTTTEKSTVYQTLEAAIETAQAAEAQTQQDWGVWEYEGVFFAAPCALHRYGDGALFDTMKHWERNKPKLHRRSKSTP